MHAILVLGESRDSKWKDKLGWDWIKYLRYKWCPDFLGGSKPQSLGSLSYLSLWQRLTENTKVNKVHWPCLGTQRTSASAIFKPDLVHCSAASKVWDSII